MSRSTSARFVALLTGVFAFGACGGGPEPDPGPAPAAVQTMAASTPASATEVDLTGDWTLDVRLDSGQGRRQASLIQDGNALSGTISSSRASGEVTGTVDGDRVRFVALLSMTGGEFEVVYEARVIGDRMVEGTVEIPGYSSGTFTGERKGML